MLRGKDLFNIGKLSVSIHAFHKARNYIIPKRLTFKSDPSIYQWLWFVMGKEK